VEYDEERELTRYIWGYFQDRMTDFERQVGLAIIAREKAANAAANVARLLAARYDSPEVIAALADGPDAFRRRVCARLLAEKPGEVFVNQCARCNRIVRTPQARQCFWCGFDWHTPNS
jgi:hypothetical protein